MYGAGLYGQQIYGDVAGVFKEEIELFAMNAILEGIKKQGVALITALETEAHKTLGVTVDFDYGRNKDMAIFTSLEGLDIESFGINTFLDYEKIGERMAVLSELEGNELVQLATKAMLETIARKGVGIYTTTEGYSHNRIALKSLFEATGKKALAFKSELEGLLIKTLSLSTFLDYEKSKTIAMIALLETSKDITMAISSSLENQNRRTVSIMAMLEGTQKMIFSINTTLEGLGISDISINTVLENGVFGRFGIQPFELESNT